MVNEEKSMSELNQEKLQELRHIFDDCDKDNNGRIDWDEFCCMLDKLLGEKTLQEKTMIFDLVDTNHNGAISFDEFSEWWGNQ